MIYQVRKDGQIFMETTSEKCRYSPSIEASMQAAGYDIYIDGKRLKKIPPGKGGRSSK